MCCVDMKVYIVEDEPLGLDRLKRMLTELDSDINIVGSAETIKSSVWWLQNNPAPDLIFMDIELADGQCFEIFNQVNMPAPVIFTTSYDDHVLKAFKLNSLDYLLKPVSTDDLKASIQKYTNLKTQLGGKEGYQNQLDELLQQIKVLSAPPDYRKRFLVKQGQKLVSIEVSEIAWIFAEGKLCFMKTWDGKRYLVDYTLEQLAKMLNPTEFFRANRSYIIHFKSIKSVNSYFGGKLILKLNPVTEGDELLVSKEKCSEFKEWMGK